ncbi:MAG: hypothetical protein C4289_05305 [Chloroflexota bacterium]
MPAGEAAGQPLSCLFPPEGQQLLARMLPCSNAEDAQPEAQTITRYQRAGREQIIEVTVARLPAPTGAAETVLSLQDITARVQRTESGNDWPAICGCSLDPPIIYETEVPSLVGHWDAARLERVLANLLAHAVKYSPAGGTIDVRLRREPEGSRSWAMIEVRDQGLGLPAADLPYIFERFYRAQNVPAQVSGSGVGLASAPDRRAPWGHHRGPE